MAWRIGKYLVLFVFFALIYMILREAVSPAIFIFGLAFAAFAVAVSDRFLLDSRYVDTFKLNIFRFIVYIIYLIYKIAVSGIKTAWFTLSGKAGHTMFTFQTTLEGDFKCNLLANSITLTPGTVTVNRDGGRLLVLQLVPEGKGSSTLDIEKFEDKLKRL